MDGGLIVQESQPFKIKGQEDLVPAETVYKGQTYRIGREPTDREYEDMLFGWYVESGVSSNSALFVKDEATVAIGTGEQDRVGVVEIATSRRTRNSWMRRFSKNIGVPLRGFQTRSGPEESGEWKTSLRSSGIRGNRRPVS